ncbi:MAG: hypothetical protein GEU71_08520 [Actinobacteria bacterium]|nr:hypothetical protein [Actinomycetota bacterium]
MSVRYEASDGLAVITLDRPELLNAFNDELGNAALERVLEASADPEVRCIVVTGAGRAFSSGEDLAALADGYARGEAPPLGDTLRNRYNPLIRALRAAPKPVVAAVNGVAAGAGVSIVLACDFRIASEKAKLVLAFVKVGLVPDAGSMWFLTRTIGAAKAFELAASGDPLDARRAHELGLFTEVVPEDGFEARWKAFAAELAGGPTRAYALIKRLSEHAAESSLDAQLEFEIGAQSEAGATADHLEGVNAFFEKRPPKFVGE